MEITKKPLLILVVVILCFCLMIVNVYQYHQTSSSKSSTTTTTTLQQSSTSSQVKTIEPVTTRTKQRESLPQKSTTHHHFTHHDDHYGEGSFDHGQTEKLTKHDVQKFLLKYFGLVEVLEDQSSSSSSFNFSSIQSIPTTEENKNNKNQLEYNQIKKNIPGFCKSRQRMVWQELKRFASPALIKALKEQIRRHEAVANGTPLPGQKYLVWSLSGGLGNRFQSLVSCFVAAMLSKRVFLMKDWFEPLPHSSVKQTPVVINSPNTDHYFLENLLKILKVEDGRPTNDELLCPFFPMTSLREFTKKYPEEFIDHQNNNNNNGDDNIAELVQQRLEKNKPFGHPQHIKVDIAARHDKTLRRWNRLFCANMSSETTTSKFTKKTSSMAKEASFFFPEKFVYIWTNQHFLPGFFSNPYHSKQMKEMFPDSNPYAVLVRVFVMPSLPVVKKIRDFFEANSDNLFHPLDYIGLQIRAFREREIEELGKYFEKCFDRHSSEVMKKEDNHSPFFLATLHSVVRQNFAKKYGTGRVVTLAPPRGEQCTGKAFCDQEALTDMFLLAFSKDLYVSPGSTFGSFVAAYVQTHPRIVTWDGNSMKVKCDRAKFLEPCFASSVWYDKLMNGRQDKFSCELEKIPSGASGCVL